MLAADLSADDSLAAGPERTDTDPTAGRQIDVVVVGLGFGAEFVPIYQAHPLVGRVGLVDTNVERLAEVGQRMAVADRYHSLEEALADDGWDAVHLLTPVAHHAEQTLMVLNSGRHCACAVPMATSLADIDRIIEAAERTGGTYMMMETSVYSREFFYARRLLHDGVLGRLSFFRGEHLQNLDGYPPYWLGFPPMHYVTHALSPALALANARAVSVRCLGTSRLTRDHVGASGEGFGTEVGLFRLASADEHLDRDLVAEVIMSFFQLGRSYREGFSVYGDAGALEWPQLEGEPLKQFAMAPLDLQADPMRRGRSVEVIDVRPPGAAELLPRALRGFAHGGHGGSHPHLVHEFVSGILERRPARVDPRTAATWTAPGICAHQSALTSGAEVAIPDFGRPPQPGARV